MSEESLLEVLSQSRLPLESLSQSLEQLSQSSLLTSNSSSLPFSKLMLDSETERRSVKLSSDEKLSRIEAELGIGGVRLGGEVGNKEGTFCNVLVKGMSGQDWCSIQRESLSREMLD